MGGMLRRACRASIKLWCHKARHFQIQPLPPVPGAAAGLEWHRSRDSFVGTVDGARAFLLDPTTHGDWILWRTGPDGIQTKMFGRYPTAADAKDAARAAVANR
jgi:hypothetical protein